MVRMVQVAATVVASLAAGQFAAIVTQPFDVVVDGSNPDNKQEYIPAVITVARSWPDIHARCRAEGPCTFCRL